MVVTVWEKMQKGEKEKEEDRERKKNKKNATFFTTFHRKHIFSFAFFFSFKQVCWFFSLSARSHSQDHIQLAQSSDTIQWPKSHSFSLQIKLASFFFHKLTTFNMNQILQSIWSATKLCLHHFWRNTNEKTEKIYIKNVRIKINI